MAVELSQKFGVDQMKTNPELELRLRKIEQAIAGKAAASTIVASVGAIAAPSGLALVNGIETIRVIWNEVDIDDLKEYEIQIDTVSTFTNPTILKTTLLTQDFVGADSNTTHFIRVRAVTTGGENGLFTGTLNTSTGQVQTDDIEDLAIETAKVQDQAITDFASESQTTIDLGDVDNGDFTAIASLTFTTITGLIFMSASYDHDGSGNLNASRVSIITRDGVGISDSLESSESENVATINNTFTFFDVQVPGTYTYAIALKLVGNFDHGNLTNVKIFAQSVKK